MNTIGERLKYARKIRGYTQQELEETSCVSRGVIRSIEGDRHSTQMVNYIACAKALGINVKWLLKGIGAMKLDDQGKILNNLFQMIAELNESQQKCLLVLVSAIQQLWKEESDGEVS